MRPSDVLNLQLMANPLNWLTVFLMCGFGLVLMAVLSPPEPRGAAPQLPDVGTPFPMIGVSAGQALYSGG